MGTKKLINSPDDELHNIVEELNKLSEQNRKRLQELFPDITFPAGSDSGSTEEDDSKIVQEKNVYFCRRCGKIIKNPLSIHMNMGPICFKHYCEENRKRTKKLF